MPREPRKRGEKKGGSEGLTRRRGRYGADLRRALLNLRLTRLSEILARALSEEYWGRSQSEVI